MGGLDEWLPLVLLQNKESTKTGLQTAQAFVHAANRILVSIRAGKLEEFYGS